MKIFIKKFGGTSIGSIDRITALSDRIYECHQAGEKMIIVLSAMSGETNRLIQMAQNIDPSYKGMAYDMLLASGEQVSISLLSIALNKKGLQTVPLLAHQVGIQTDSLFSSARIKNINTDLILKLVKQNKVPLIAGFQGVNKDNQITTLGRGGSDITAVALSAVLKQSFCEIYTDVPNICTADPRLIKSAQKISQLSFDVMMEMAILGTKVLHFRCVELAAKFNIKIHLQSAFEKTPGTWILPKEEIMENPIVSAVISDLNICVVKLFPIPSGLEFISTVFNKLSKKSIIVDVISQSYNSEGQRLAFSIKEEQVSTVLEILSSLIDKNKITLIKDAAKVSIVGVGMANQSGVAAQFFETVQKSQAHLHLVTTSDIKISAIIDKTHSLSLTKELHKTFNLE